MEKETRQHRIERQLLQVQKNREHLQSELYKIMVKREQIRLQNQIEWVTTFLIGIGICIIYAIFSIHIGSAMYAGESYTFTTNLTDPIYTVTGNSSDLTGLLVEYDGGNITVSTDMMFKPDNFTLLFSQRDTETITHYVGSGGGGSYGSGGTRTIYENQTVYEPEYVNNTEIQWLQNTEYVDNSWLYRIMMASGIIMFIAVVWIATNIANKLKREDEEDGESDNR